MSADRPAPGLVVHQPEGAFRYGSEAWWLAGFALEGGPARTAADLGTGSGIIALLLASAGVEAVGYDRLAAWSPLWVRTLDESRVAAPIRLVTRDVGEGIDGPVDLVVSNPPFFAAGTGPAPADPWRRAARFEEGLALDGFVGAGLDALAPGGRLCLVLPLSREGEACAAGERRGAVPRRRVQVGARRILVELARGGAPSTREVVEDDGERVAAWYARFGSAPSPRTLARAAGPE